MIYEINSNEIPLAMQINENFQFIIMSRDHKKSLVKIDNIENIEILNSYSDEQLNNILLKEQWQQKCINC
jgi:hypothetical protein